MHKTDIENSQPLVVCIHASASSRGQWSTLVAAFAGHLRVLTPDLIGYGKSPHFIRGMKIQDEVDNVLRQIEAEAGKTNSPLHLVGHSYGGAVALQIALMYPERVASLTVYEPAQFLLLFDNGVGGDAAQEILTVHRFVQARKNSWWQRRAAARYFIEYWSGRGAWSKLRFRARRRLVRLLPKVAAEFNAILSAGVSAADVAMLHMPVRVICGTATRAPASAVSEALAAAAPCADRVMVDGVAHMAPVTHAKRINPLILEHVFTALSVDVKKAA
ncbi:MAG: alpha/beta hydrolase [Gammaproteobacteria bacterium]|nr:alpha/beta hydrolase [Gammaproteobacteria bacterium]